MPTEPKNSRNLEYPVQIDAMSGCLNFIFLIKSLSDVEPQLALYASENFMSCLT